MRLALALLSVSALLGQEPSAIEVDVGLVNIAFTAHDARGHIVADLTDGEIEVFEDGVLQPVRFFGQSAQLPLRLALIVDGSITQGEFNFEHRAEFGSFAEHLLGPSEKALLVLFANRIAFATDFTSSPQDLLKGFDTADTDSNPVWKPDRTTYGLRREGRALFDAVGDTSRLKMTEPGARKAMIVLSNGSDNASAHDLIEAIEAAQKTDSLIYTIHYSAARYNAQLNTRDRYGRMEMFRLADETGGIAYDSARTPVAKALAEISTELRSLYDLGYATPRPGLDGTYRKIELRTKRPGVTIRSRHGYYAR